MISFDTILSENIKFGNYQKRIFTSIGLAIYINGFSEYYQLQILEVLRSQDHYDTEDLELLSSAQFLGMTLGYLLQSFVTDVIGRRGLFILSTLFFTILLFAHGLVSSITAFIVIRILLGIVFAIIESSGYTIVCEITPHEIRGRMLSLLNFIFILGVWSNGIFCFILWDSIDSGQWRILFFIFGTLSVFSFLLNLLILRESPRFLLTKLCFEQGFQEIDLMGFLNQNQSYQPLNYEQKKALIEQYKPMDENLGEITCIDLLSRNLRKTTLILWIIYVLQNIINNGFIVLIPFISEDSKQNLSDLPLYNSLEIFAPVVTTLLIDHKLFGRRRGLNLGYFLCFIALIFMFLLKDSSVLICITFQRFAQRLTWIFLSVIALESYNTKYRTLGYGISNCIGKSAGTIAPFIFIPLYLHIEYLPFLVLGIITAINGALVTLLPSELTQKPLDSISPTIENPQAIKEVTKENINLTSEEL